MIGVSTGQNIANLVPAVNDGLDIKGVLLLESKVAKTRAWSEGIIEVLLARGISAEPLDISEFDSDILKIQERLKDEVKDESKPIVWNLAGGLKPQQIAIWEVFRYRNEKMGISDIVCYPNASPAKKELEIWRYEAGEIVRKSEKIQVNLNAKEIFGVFGFQVAGLPTCIYRKGENIEFETVDDFFFFFEFREFLFRLPVENHAKNTQVIDLTTINEVLRNQKTDFADAIFKAIKPIFNKIGSSNNFRQNFLGKQNYRENEIFAAMNKARLVSLFGEIIKRNLPQTSIPVKSVALKEKLNTEELVINEETLAKITNGKFKKASWYFEQIVVQRVIQVLKQGGHNIIEAFANLETEENGNRVAEYDILCVTDQGTIIALDAKTFDLEKKDGDARLYNLEKGSGYYRKFSAVLPFDHTDINQEWMKPIRNLSFDLDKRKFGFFVVNDSSSKPFWLKKNGNQFKVLHKEPSVGEYICCKPLQMFIE